MEFNFEGVHVSQTIGVQKYFSEILHEFDRIIEIGTYNGGLTLFLHRNKGVDCDLISYDINVNYNQVPKDIKIDFRIGDCFSEPTFSEIVRLILDGSKRVLLLCDGGNKNKEFNIFSQYLKIGDVIMLHDYSESDEDYKIMKENAKWNYNSESSLDKIIHSINNNNLEKYYYNEFKSVLWGSFIKK